VSVASRKARLAGLVAHRDPADPDIEAARAELAEAKLEQRIREVVDGWPPLTPAQRERLALLLHPGSGADAA
jgi:hypothetical protein